MIDPIKQAIFQRLADVCELTEDIRIGQLISFMPVMTEAEPIPNLADLEDADLLQALNRHYEDLLKWRASKAESVA